MDLVFRSKNLYFKILHRALIVGGTSMLKAGNDFLMPKTFLNVSLNCLPGHNAVEDEVNHAFGENHHG